SPVAAIGTDYGLCLRRRRRLSQRSLGRRELLPKLLPAGPDLSWSQLVWYCSTKRYDTLPHVASQVAANRWCSVASARREPVQRRVPLLDSLQWRAVRVAART